MAGGPGFRESWGLNVVKKMHTALQWAGISVYIGGFFLAIARLNSTGVMLIDKLEDIFALCFGSVLLGTILIAWSQVSKNRNSKCVENHNGGRKWKLYHLGDEKSSSDLGFTKSPPFIVVMVFALLSGALGGILVELLYIPIFTNGSTEWPDEGGFVAMLFATVILPLLLYLWLVFQRLLNPNLKYPWHEEDIP